MARDPQLPVVRQMPPILEDWAAESLGPSWMMRALPQRFYPGNGYIPMQGPNWGPADHPEFFSPSEMRNPVPGEGGPVVAGSGGSNTLAGGGGETLTVGPNEEAVSSSLNIVDASDRLKTAKNARPLGTVQGMVYHHSVAPSADKTINALNARRLGAEYVIDRDGTVYQTFPTGMAATHMRDPGSSKRTDAGKITAEFGNANLIGVEVAAADDADVTPAQVAAAQQLTADLSVKYGFPPQNVWGHGELQSNKQSTEGMTIVNAIRAANPAPPVAVDTAGRDKLAGVMLAEARGEGREGMAGVGNVVLNRQAAGGNRFPKTIDEVINNEFAKPLGPNDVLPEEWADATNLATQLQNGAVPDNTGGAVYFANTATARSSKYAQIAASGPVSTTIGNHTYHVDSKIGPVARTGAPQSAPVGPINLAGLTNPSGGTLTPGVPAGTEAYAPFLPGAGGQNGQDGQAAIADLLGLPPPPVAQSFAPTVPETASPAAPRRPGPGGAIGVDLGMQPAGMPPPPSRPGTFDWLGGGAPEAAMVPPPGISPLRPAFGGPGDRRPQPPIPQLRPDALGIPDPRMRPSAPQSPVEAFSPPAGPSDLVPFLPPPAATAAPAIAPPLERTARKYSGQGGPVIPISPDEMRSSLANANANRERTLGVGWRGNLGTPETAMSIGRGGVGPVGGFDRAARAGQIMGLPPSLNTGEFPISGGGGSDALAAGNASPLSPPPPALMPPALMPSGDPWASAYGQRPDMAAQLGIHNIATAAPEPRYDPLSSIHLPPPVVSSDIDKIPGVTVAADPDNITLPTEPTAQVDAEQAPTIDPVVAAANQPHLPPPPRQKVVTTAAATPTKAAEEEKKRNSFLSQFLPGGGSIFGIGPGGFFSNAGSFTPFAGAGGTSPFNQQPNGQMGRTTWRQGSVTGNPAMSGVMWNRSGNNGSVGYVTDPITGSMIYSGSPNRF